MALVSQQSCRCLNAAANTPQSEQFVCDVLAMNDPRRISSSAPTDYVPSCRDCLIMIALATGDCGNLKLSTLFRTTFPRSHSHPVVMRVQLSRQFLMNADWGHVTDSDCDSKVDCMRCIAAIVHYVPTSCLPAVDHHCQNTGRDLTTSETPSKVRIGNWRGRDR